MRTEFGAERTSCACEACRRCCRFLPAWLIPSDLERMIPAGADPSQWAEANLLASPGPLVEQIVERTERTEDPGQIDRGCRSAQARNHEASRIEPMVHISNPNEMARSERFELPTLGIEIRCSIQLSYERPGPGRGHNRDLPDRG